MEQIIHIKLEDLHSAEFDHRLTTNPIKDIELQESIRELGILEPLVVRKINKGYEIMIGGRRHRAAGKLGLPTVPCIINKASGVEVDKIMIHENIKRDDLGHIDQAYLFCHLIEKYKMTEEKVANLIGKSVPYVSQHLTLIRANDKLIAGVQDETITFSISRELVRVKDIDERNRLQEQIVDHGASLAVVKSWVNESNRETLTSNPAGGSYEPTVDSPPSYKTTYPCQACERHTDVSELKIARLCPECFYQIFNAIREQQVEMTSENHK